MTPACLLLFFSFCETVPCSPAWSQTCATKPASFTEDVGLTFLKCLCWKLLSRCMVLSDSSFLSLALCGHLLFSGVILTEALCVSVCFLFSSSPRSRALHSAQQESSSLKEKQNRWKGTWPFHLNRRGEGSPGRPG